MNMNREKQSPDKESRIAIAGELTLSRAHQLRAELLECLSNERETIVDLEQVTEIDLACLQVLLAARNSQAGSRRLIFREGDRVSQAWQEAGYPAGEAPGG